MADIEWAAVTFPTMWPAPAVWTDVGDFTLLVFAQVGVPTWEVRRRAKLSSSSRDDLVVGGTADTFEAAKTAALFEACARSPDHLDMLCSDQLAVAEAMLDGEIAYRKGDFDLAFARLRDAVELEDALPYDEPWGWMQPSRHALGALLLEQGRVEEAEAVYREDLGWRQPEPGAHPPGQRLEPAGAQRLPVGPRRGGDP